MKHSESLAELAARLAVVQTELPAFPRTKNVKVRTRTGGEYSFKYAPLDEILALAQPILAKHELAITQVLDEGPSLTTTLMHSSGDWISGSVDLPTVPGMSAQEIGSLITYMRRYAVVAILGIATEEDDDGNHASKSEVLARSAGDQGTDGPPMGGSDAAAASPSPAEKARQAQERANPKPNYDGTAESVILPTGKHKGKRLGDVPKSYQRWVAENWGEKTSEDRLIRNSARALTGQGFDPLPELADDGIPF